MLVQGRTIQLIALLAAAGIGATPSHAQSQRDSIPASQVGVPKVVLTDEAVSSVAQKDTPRRAQGGAGTPATPNPSPATLVTNAERLAIKFLGYAELAGEYRLAPEAA